ncbi:6.8 kDa mitochondrial proteolipid [Anabarilius grahami]|uniref:6.8 kDa mitochondrial proteolipid n=1 Tax=Anabarilius grahami TaxID=495550 RepID=A0A3N0YXZ5_ANAGA|nr:6.8 kDa mitochondrial proteolipid [Anabarilius grahami]
MAGGAFAGWWTKVAPYYTKAYQEMWVGVGIMTFMYYKLSYGGERSGVRSVYTFLKIKVINLHLWFHEEPLTSIEPFHSRGFL